MLLVSVMSYIICRKCGCGGIGDNVRVPHVPAPFSSPRRPKLLERLGVRVRVGVRVRARGQDQGYGLGHSGRIFCAGKSYWLP